MHGKILLFTDNIPSDYDIDEIMKAYSYWEPEVDTNEVPFYWDSYVVGGRYSGGIHAKVSTIEKNNDYVEYRLDDINNIEILSMLLNKLNCSGVFEEHLYYGYIMEQDGSIRCDGAKVRAITNLNDISCYICLDKNEAYCRDTSDNFDSKVNNFLDKYYEKDGFVTVLDIHW